MLVYWEWNASGVQVKNSDTEEEDENCEIQKPQMQNTKDEEQRENLMVNIILIFDLQMTKKSMNNNCKGEGFGMQRSNDDLTQVSAESTEVFAQLVKKLV